MSSQARSLQAVTVFCGSSTGTDPAYAEATRQMGHELVERGIGVIYGGGDVGLMGVLANTVLDAGGHVTGIIPQDLWDKEVGHGGLSELLVVSSMHERKLAMADRADAFVALPGGVGTFEELFEVLTWTQLGIHHKPAGVLEVNGFYTPLLTFMDSTVDAGFVRPGHRSILRSSSSPADLLDQLAAWQPTIQDKWLDRTQR